MAAPDELTTLIDGLRSVLRSVADNEPTPDRTPHLVTAISFPAGEEPPHTRQLSPSTFSAATSPALAALDTLCFYA